MLAVLVVAASGCGTEVAASPQARPTAPGPSWATPVPVRYLSVAQGKGAAPVVWPVVTDIGTTGKVELTAWLLKFAN